MTGGRREGRGRKEGGERGRDGGVIQYYTLPTDQLFNLEFQFESVFNLEFQPKFGIQFGIPILMGINFGECMLSVRGQGQWLPLWSTRM